MLQARLQQYMNHELPDTQAGFRKGRRTRDQIANICWIIEKAREFQKNIHFCSIDYGKAFDYVDLAVKDIIIHVLHQESFWEIKYKHEKCFTCA